MRIGREEKHKHFACALAAICASRGDSRPPRGGERLGESLEQGICRARASDEATRAEKKHPHIPPLKKETHARDRAGLRGLVGGEAESHGGRVGSRRWSCLRCAWLTKVVGLAEQAASFCALCSRDDLILRQQAEQKRPLTRKRRLPPRNVCATAYDRRLKPFWRVQGRFGEQSAEQSCGAMRMRPLLSRSSPLGASKTRFWNAMSDFQSVFAARGRPVREKLGGCVSQCRPSGVPSCFLLCAHADALPHNQPRCFSGT